MTQPDGGLRVDPVRAASIRTLFQQIPNSFAAAAVVTVYMAATAAPYSPPATIAIWLTVQVSTQILRLWLVALYRRIPADDDGRRLERAALRNTLYMLLAGVVWGSTAFVFVHVEQPLTVAFTLCGLYGISGGSVPGNAYNPVGLFAFIAAIFGLVMVRMVMLGDYGHMVLGVASLCYAAILASFCRVQAREIAEGFAIRFENRRLLAALEVEKGEAETARARAEKANLAKSQLLAAASHDLRQPLHALSLFSGSLQSLALDDAAKDVASPIQSNVAAMEKLFNGLLDISRLEAGVVEAWPEPVCLQDLFDRLAGYFDPVADAQGLDLRFRDTGLWVNADPALIEQICVNLMTNAIRYTRRGGILMAARRRGDGVVIEVSDTGIGIPWADQDRIFDEFVQLGNPERDRGKGLGLGLAIAQRLAEIQGSRIALVSVEGKGSRFSLALPGAAPAGPARRPAAAPDLMNGLRLLLVDDDAMVRESTGLLLRQWGVEAALASDLATAEAAIEAAGGPFDVCLTDYRLTGTANGLAVIALLASRSDAPRAFCLVTGDMSPDLLAQADAAGVAIIHKPLHPARLRALLNHLVAQGPSQPRAALPAAVLP